MLLLRDLYVKQNVVLRFAEIKYLSLARRPIDLSSLALKIVNRVF